MIPVVKYKEKLALALAIATEVLIMLEKEIIDISPLFTDKSIKTLTKNYQSQQCIYLVFYSSFLLLTFLQ